MADPTADPDEMDTPLAVRGLRVRNVSGESIPQFAVLRITGYDADAGVFLVDKPNAASLTVGILLNGPVQIPATADGSAASGSGGGSGGAAGGEGAATVEFPAVILCSASDAAPVAGDSWGTEAGGWALRKGHTGFVCEGNALTATAGHYAQFVAESRMGDRVEIVEPHSSGVAPPDVYLTDGRVRYANLTTTPISLDVGELCWNLDVNEIP